MPSVALAANSAWTFYVTDVGMSAALSASNPILGTSALRIARNAVGTSNISAHGALITWSHGWTRGRMRTAYRLDTHTATTDHGMGLYCLASQADLTAGVGACYALALRTSTTGGTIDSLRLVKYSAGLAAPTGGVVLATYATGNIVLGTIVCIELEWRVDLTALGGVALTGRYATGFVLPAQPTLPTVLTYTDTSSPLTSSVGEGVWIFANGTGDHTSTFGETAGFHLP